MGWHKRETSIGVCWYPWNKFKQKYVKKDNKALELAKKNLSNSKFSITKTVFKDWVSVTDGEHSDTLPSGIYKFTDVNHTQCLVEFNPSSDKILFELDVSKKVIKDFDVFIKSKKIYQEQLKLVYKKGILLYGPPGTGKTTAIQLILRRLQKSTKNSLVIWTKSMFNSGFITEFKQDPRLKVIILEELTHLIKHNWELDELLTFLDGEQSIENCFIIATTNYPELLPHNLVDRSGRFDRLYKIDYLNENDRKVYVSYCLGRDATDQELDITKDLPISDIKEMLLMVLKDKLTITEARREINYRKELVRQEFRESKPIGFNREND